MQIDEHTSRRTNRREILVKRGGEMRNRTAGEEDNRHTNRMIYR